MNDLFDQIQQKLNELSEITRVSNQLHDVMANPCSTTEDFDKALSSGMKVLEDIEQRNTKNEQ